MNDATEQTLLADRLAIHELAVRYCDATTRGDWAAFEALWTADAVWAESEPYGQRFVGRDEIVRRSRETLDAADVFIQLCHGVVIEELSADRARAHATVQGIARGRHGSSVNYVVFKDRLVKTGGEWRYVERDLHNIYFEDRPLTGEAMLTRPQVAALCAG